MDVARLVVEFATVLTRPQNDPELALAGLRLDLEVLANNLAGGFKAGRRLLKNRHSL
jgi:hypothetical protein